MIELGLLPLVGLVAGFTEIHDRGASGWPQPAIFSSEVYEVCLAKDVAIGRAPIDVYVARMVLNLRDLVGRQSATQGAGVTGRALRAYRSDGNPIYDSRSPQAFFLRLPSNGYRGPSHNVVSGRLPAIFDDGSAANETDIEGGSEPTAIGDAREIWRKVSAQLPMGRPLGDANLNGANSEQQKRQDGYRVPKQAEQPVSNTAQEGWGLAVGLLVAGVVGTVGAWRAGERYPRLAIGLFAVFALLGAIGLVGLSDTLCADGACR